MGVPDGGEDGVMAEDFLNVEQADAGFNQVCRIGMAQAVRGNLFLNLYSG